MIREFVIFVEIRISERVSHDLLPFWGWGLNLASFLYVLFNVIPLEQATEATLTNETRVIILKAKITD
jgi:hypothetical protein